MVLRERARAFAFEPVGASPTASTPISGAELASRRMAASSVSAPTGSSHEGRPTSGLVLPGILLGIGLGGFFDGILLHQIFQWHHMLTSYGPYPATTVAGLEVNTLWDGLFHASTYMATLAGLLILAQRVRSGLAWSTRVLIGLLLAGWGTFNLVEGVIDHHILGIHHVKADMLILDYVFLAVGAVLLVGGLALARRGQRDAEARRPA